MTTRRRGILSDLLQDEQFLFGAGLLSAGSMGQNLGQAALPSMINAARTANLFQNQQRMNDLRETISDSDMSGFTDIEKALIAADPFKGLQIIQNKKKRTTNFKTLFKKDGSRIELDLNDPVDAAKIPNLSAQGYSLSKFDQKDNRTTIQKLAEDIDPEKGDLYNQIITNKINKETINPVLLLLNEAGITKDDPRYKEAVLASIARTAEGFESASPIKSKGKQDNLVIGGQYSVKGLDKILNFADLTNASPEIFGATGRLFKFGSDVMKEYQSVFGTDESELVDIDDDVKRLLANKDFSTLDQLMNSLSINIARVRNPQGKLMKDMIDDAKDDTNFKGLGGVVAVREKLKTLYNELEDDARQKFELAGYSQSRINSILDQKRRSFEQKIGMIQKKLVLDEDGIYRYK